MLSQFIVHVIIIVDAFLGVERLLSFQLITYGILYYNGHNMWFYVFNVKGLCLNEGHIIIS